MNPGNPAITVTDLRANSILLPRFDSASVCVKSVRLSRIDSITALTKRLLCWNTDVELNSGYRSWKLGVNPTQGRCCNSPTLLAWVTGKVSPEGAKDCVFGNAGDKPEYLPVFPPRESRGTNSPADCPGSCVWKKPLLLTEVSHLNQRLQVAHRRFLLFRFYFCRWSSRLKWLISKKNNK